MDNELKPCPFCGNAANLEISYSYTKQKYYLHIECKTCHAKSKILRSDERPEDDNIIVQRIVNAWNTRA